MKTLSLSLAALALLSACAGKDARPDAAARTSTVRLPQRPGLYVRTSFDSDGQSLIGRWVPDDTPDAELDEGSLATTRCSAFIKPREVKAGGRTNEVFNANQSFGAKLGVPGIAKVGGEKSDTSAVRIDYEATGKQVADVDQKGLQQCCRAYPDQCQGRYISQAVLGKGFIYTATEQSLSAAGDGKGTSGGIPFGADAFYKDGLKWERQTEFDGQYFAFGLARYLPSGAGAVACGWVNKPPTSMDGEYFIGVSAPRTTEQEARDDASENAELQVVAYMGKWLGQQSSTSARTTGPAAELQTAVKDERNTQRMTEGLARFVKVEEYCPDQEMTPTGKRYTVKALAFLPNEQRDAAARLSIANLMNALREQNRLTPERQKELERIMSGLGGAVAAPAKVR